MRGCVACPAAPCSNRRLPSCPGPPHPDRGGGSRYFKNREESSRLHGRPWSATSPRGLRTEGHVRERFEFSLYVVAMGRISGRLLSLLGVCYGHLVRLHHFGHRGGRLLREHRHRGERSGRTRVCHFCPPRARAGSLRHLVLAGVFVVGLPWLRTARRSREQAYGHRGESFQ
ncbi:hypothetical protein THIOKS13320002 [Thiocapsa sp. KS1]|nr:hypothetical protein THIOKS13320002 [Thiocapsa sp. KS1]